MLLEQNNSIIKDSTIEEGAIIHPFVCIINSRVESGAEILPFSYIENSFIKKGARVFASVIENSLIESGAVVGPYSHLRQGAVVKENAKIGNFVEVKNSVVGKETKASHLSYIGDATIGEKSNIGCGVVFVNYNGKIKQQTHVGNNCFVGSSVNLIAPVQVGDKSFICAGTTVDGDVLPGEFVIGRSRMTKKPNKAHEYLKGE